MLWLVVLRLHEQSSHNKLPPLPQTEVKFSIAVYHNFSMEMHSNTLDPRPFFKYVYCGQALWCLYFFVFSASVTVAVMGSVMIFLHFCLVMS